MNPVPLFLIIVTLPLLLGGCGEKTKLESVNYDELEDLIEDVEELEEEIARLNSIGHTAIAEKFDTELDLTKAKKQELILKML